MTNRLEPPPFRNLVFEGGWRNWLRRMFETRGTPGTVEANKSIVPDDDLTIDQLDIDALSLGGTAVTSTAGELNILDGVTATTAELNYNDITTLGTVEASKTVTADANKDVAGFRYISFGGQLAFPATQAASADANTLDDYEEGTWTPTLGGITSETGQSYTTRYGNYIKIGKNVTCFFEIDLPTPGTITGNAVIKGLPFTIASAANGGVSGASFGVVSSVGENFVWFSGYSVPSTTYISIYYSSTAGKTSSVAPNTMWQSGTPILYGKITYSV